MDEKRPLDGVLDIVPAASGTQLTAQDQPRTVGEHRGAAELG